jgi:hypothetical protein
MALLLAAVGWPALCGAGWLALLAAILPAPAAAEIDFPRARHDFVSGRATYDLTAIDFDEDGDLDLACIRFTLPGAVTLLENDGRGRFSFFTQFTTGDVGTSILAADIDEDGHADLVSTGWLQGDTGTIGLHRGDGQGGFTTTFLPFPGANPFRVNGADLDGDGHLDLVAGGSGDGFVRVLKGDGNGQFALSRTLPGGAVPIYVAIGDIDADGDRDLAVADQDGEVLVYLGDGTGDFAPAVILEVAASPRWIDIRTMGDPDRPYLAVAQWNTAEGEDGVDVFRWDPVAGALTLVSRLDTPGDPNSVAFVEPVFFHDVARSGERLPGLAVACQGSSELWLYRSIPYEPLILVTQEWPTAVRIADWTGDGIPDFVLPGWNTESLSLFAGSGALADHAPAIDVSGDPLHVRAIDMDGNPRPDLAILRRAASRLTVLLGGPLALGVPTFTEMDIGDPFPDIPNGLAVFDAGDDGAPDFAVGRAVGSQFWVLRSSTGYAREEIAMTGALPAAIEAADLDGDTHDDLAVALYMTDNLSVHFGSDSGFETAIPVAAGDAPIALAVADLDGNGLSDLVTANDLGGSIALALQEPARVFSPQPEVPIQVGRPGGIAAGHLDDDDFPDVVIAGNLGIEILAGDGAGGIESVDFIPTAAEFGTLRLADLDGDGAAEIVAADLLGDAIVVFARSPTGEWRESIGYPPLSFGVDRNPVDFAVIDLDTDARPDLAVVARSANRLTMLLTGGIPAPAQDGERSGTTPPSLQVEWSPNPFTEETGWRVDLAAPAPVILRLFDAAGRRVATPFTGLLPAGPQVLTFDGRDDEGRMLPRGVYFYRLEAGDQRARGKLVRR